MNEFMLWTYLQRRAQAANKHDDDDNDAEYKHGKGS